LIAVRKTCNCGKLLPSLNNAHKSYLKFTLTKSINKQTLGQTLNWLSTDILSAPPLVANELHLWQAPLQLRPDQIKPAIALLNDTQRDKYYRRTTTKLQLAYLAGRFYLLNLLAAYSQCPPADINLSLTRLNKPYLNPNPLQIEFNFTDCATPSGFVGLYALTYKNAVGVDIEPLSRQGDFSKIAKRRFSPAELELVSNNQGQVDSQRFLAYWTRKEAFGKATGKGINYKMNQMDFASYGKFDLNFLDNDKANSPYRLEQIQINQQLIASVAHQGHQPLLLRAFSVT